MLVELALRAIISSMILHMYTKGEKTVKDCFVNLYLKK